ncbi:MAG: hypothetical protein WCK89_04215 [bacterium]
MRRVIVSAFVWVLCLSVQAEEWYRGNLHMHSLWSDGNVFPEDAVGWYRDHGYQFVTLSDHQMLQLDTHAWLEAGSQKLSREKADAYVKGHPASAELKKEGGKEYLRLKTVWESKRMFDQPEAFLMVPGHELNHVAGGLQVHMNVINVSDTLPYRYGDSPSEIFQRIETALDAWGRAQDVPTLFMLNHPTWPCFDIRPEVLIGLPRIRFFEVCNADGGTTFPPHPLWYSLEKFWDIVNAFRIEDGYDPVFGTATDDTHTYTDPRGGARPGVGWVCVRAARLDPHALLQAMYRGEFYASTGVALERVAFDGEKGTLSVKVRPDAGATYTVRFTTTQAGFDRTTEAFDDPAKEKKPARTGIRYSDMIGKTAKTVEGLEASYTLGPDDLYVRATVTSSKKAVNRVSNEPEFDTAWTQPCGWRAWQGRNPLKARLTPKKGGRRRRLSFCRRVSGHQERALLPRQTLAGT